MSLSNPWFVAAVLGVLAVFHLELLSTLLNLARFRKPLPPLLEDVFPEDTRVRAAEYASASARHDFVQQAAQLILLLGFWWSGGFGWLQSWAEGFGQSPVVTGVIVITAIVGVQTLISLPFEWWDTFGLESEFGFNRTTPATFVTDRLKSLALSAAIGLPIAALIVWFFETQKLAAIYAWLSIASFSILMTWLAPRLIMPLFLKFQPLEAGPLKEAILALAARLNFPVGEVSVVDGSRRSAKANAFFAGFGKTRRIALYDTLLQNHTPEEIVAVLAHEIGHNKRRHVPVHLVVALLEMGVMFGLLNWVLKAPEFFAAFGVTGTPVGMGLILFAILYQPLTTLLNLGSLALSRRHEFEADAFAAEAVGGHEPLSSGLKKLSRDHLAHPQPHPLTVALHYSHPPLSERLGALAQLPLKS